MPHSEYFCHACKPLSKAAPPVEYKEGQLICPRCGSKEVE